MEFLLNKAQAAAVEHEEGSAIIIAGAGTGKTRVITQRIIRLLEKQKCLPENILALTFTEKAAAEMQERIDLTMPLGFGEVKIRTFHAFCKEVLAESGIEMGIDPDFKLMDQVTSWIFIRENLTKFKLDYFRPLGNPTKFISNLSSHFSRLKEEDISPKTYTDYAESLSVEKIYNEMLLEWEAKEAAKKRKSNKEPPLEEFKKEAELIIKKERELAKAYQIYAELLLKESKMDFGGLIYLVLDLFRKRPNILAEYQKRYQFILVDEFQDTNYAQNELVEMLATRHDNLMVVGDDDQAIYKFRGASLSNILQFEAKHPNCENFVLTENYRSAQNILDLAYQSIQNNNPNRLETKLGINKRLLAKKLETPLRGQGGVVAQTVPDSGQARKTIKGIVDEDFSIEDKIKVWQFQDDLSEADQITEEILSIIKSPLRGLGGVDNAEVESVNTVPISEAKGETGGVRVQGLPDNLPTSNQEDIAQESNKLNLKVQVRDIEPTKEAVSCKPRSTSFKKVPLEKGEDSCKEAGGLRPQSKQDPPQPPFQGGIATDQTTNYQLPTTNFSDIALLVRNRASADIFLGELDRKGIPYQFVGNRGLFLQPEIKELINFLTVLSNPSDNVALFGLMQSRYFNFKQIDLVKYLQTARQKNLSLFSHLEELYQAQAGSETVDMFSGQAVSDEPRATSFKKVPLENGDLGGLRPQEKEKSPHSLQDSFATKNLNDFIALLHTYIEKSQTMSVGQLLWDFLKELNFEQHLSQIAQKQGISACQLFSGNINEFFRKITSFEKNSEEKTVLLFMDYLNVQIEAGDNPKTAESSDEDAVQIMTIHAAKGLEFKTVFVPALVQNKFPAINRREAIVLADELVKETEVSEDFHTEEERRLFYVAVTRAKENLYLSYAENYNSGSRKWKCSDFLTEIMESPHIAFQKFEQKTEIMDDLESKFTVKKFTQAEKQTAQNLFKHQLSYTQINTFKRCPKLYHYRYLLRIPSEPGVAAGFGSSVHNALKDFYRQLKKKQQVPTFEALKLYLQKNWQSNGYRHAEEEKDYYQKALQILQQFYESNQPNWIIPEKIEEAFRLKLYNETGYFVLIDGRIDRIDKLEDGTFEVIDYKTGQLSPFVKKGLAKDLQLSLYAIATRDFLQMDSTKFSLYFLKDNRKISTTRAEEVLIQAKKEIWEVVEQIKTGDFTATPGQMVCPFCDYRKICPNALL